MEATVARILHDLRIIARIRIGDKICITDERLDIDREGYLQPIVRTVYGSTRRKACTHINNTVDTAIALYTLLSESSKIDDDGLYRRLTLHNITSELKAASIGISNLITTYHNDMSVVTQLRSINERIMETV